MTDAADRIFTNGVVHTLTDADEQAAAVAVRDGEIVRVTNAYEVEFLAGVETDVVDLDGRSLLPGFVDAHTHLVAVGRRQVHADLSDADCPGECIDLLTATADVRDDWILGFGYDESGWDERRYLTRDDLDAVSESRPVAAFREDLHTVSLNGVALDRLADALPADDVRTASGESTGVVVEAAADAVRDAVEPTGDELRDLLCSAQTIAHERGVTAVHEMVRRPAIPRVYRELAAEGRLSLRVRLNYWIDRLDAVVETGLTTNHGDDVVQTGAIKCMADGSIGARTARLVEPYADADDERGQWLRDPDELRAFAERVDDEEFQAAVHAIGDEAIDGVLDAFADADPGLRHRIEHAEVLTDDLLERLGASDLVVSAQPNFLKWASEGGLYDARLGAERRRATNRYRDLLDAGATLAFGSDCMPLDPLFGVQQAVTAPVDGQRLSVDEAVRAYTRGGAYAGFDEHRFGTIEVGKQADFVVLERSPWAVPEEEIADVAVAMTVVDGEVVADCR